MTEWQMGLMKRLNVGLGGLTKGLSNAARRGNAFVRDAWGKHGRTISNVIGAAVNTLGTVNPTLGIVAKGINELANHKGWDNVARMTGGGTKSTTKMKTKKAVNQPVNFDWNALRNVYRKTSG